MVVMRRYQKLREERLGGQVLLSKLSKETGLIDGSYYAVLWPCGRPILNKKRQAGFSVYMTTPLPG